MFLAHKTELKPNNKQTTYFARSCGVARFAYNWALSEWKKQYQQNQKYMWHTHLKRKAYKSTCWHPLIFRQLFAILLFLIDLR